MKITHLAHSNSVGGAANFATRVIESVESIGIQNELLASNVKVETSNIHVLSNNGYKSMNYLKAKTSQSLDRKLRSLERTKQYTYKSPNLIGALRAKNLNKLDNDLFHMHWISGGLISIRQIGKLKKPIVWTMLDMWPFLGAEHYNEDAGHTRFVNGYSKNNRPNGDFGLDLCKITWNLKMKYFKNINLVAPSRWLANQAKASLIFHDQKIEVIPAPIDTLQYQPIERKTARLKFGISDQSFVIGFLGGIADRKGWAYIKEMCTQPNVNPKWKFLLAGSPISSYSSYKEINRSSILAGGLKTISDLISFYSSIDVLLVPSTVEAYGLVAQEAQACGVPVIVFSNTGAEDIIIDNLTGYIVKERSVKELLSAIEFLSSLNVEQRVKISVDSRARAHREWNYKAIGGLYLNFYNSILDQKLPGIKNTD